MTQNRFLRSFTSALGLTLLAFSAQAATIEVNTNDDLISNDGLCSLREAIQAANTDAAFMGCTAGSGADTLSLQSLGTYLIEIPGSNEDLNQTGDFDVRGDLTIRPQPLVGDSTIRGEFLDRVFQLFDGANLTLERIRVLNGEVVGFGGCILSLEPESEIRLFGSLVSSCTATLFGGGIYSVGPLIAEDSFVNNNAATSGGAVYMDGALGATFLRSGVQNNDASSDGAGFHGALLTATDSLFSANDAGRDGGAIFIPFSGDAGDVSQLVNTTVAFNESFRDGGGIYFESPGTLEIFSSTIARNQADFDANDLGDGGGIFVGSGTVKPWNTIFAANEDLSPGATNAPNCSGPIESQDYNLFAAIDFGDCIITGSSTHDINGSIGSPIDDRLDVCVGQNGGPMDTLLPLAGSPVIDAGNPAGCAGPGGTTLALDARGFFRSVDGPDPDEIARCDIGAVEVDSRPGTPEIFEDGFEAGNTGFWSLTVPGGALAGTRFSGGRSPREPRERGCLR